MQPQPRLATVRSAPVGSAVSLKAEQKGVGKEGEAEPVRGVQSEGQGWRNG